MMTSLAQLAMGETAQVLTVAGDERIAKRLLEMGVVPGVSVRVIKTAPLGDPLEIRVHNYHLALRRHEASHITVAPEKQTLR